MRTAFIINGSAGSGCDDAWLAQHRDAMEALGAEEGRITLARDGSQIAAAARAALDAGCERVVAGGGDGTVSAVAAHLVGREAALGVLPLGTLNHFAKDLRLPLDTLAAFQTLREGRVQAVDVGEVNGEYFINNSSLGLYPRIVRGRERQQRQLGRGKWPAFVWACLHTLRRYPFVDLHLKVDGRDFYHRTPFVFVGNNEYQMSGLRIGARERLDGGQLSLYLAHRTGRWGLLRLALHALVGRLHQVKDFRSVHTDAFRIDTGDDHLRVATDGEVQLMRPPLRYRIHPRALRVIVPAGG
ncbi:diacylglycerol/lipid kinase family protein [Ideonella sp. BN130291]|uniref:diacylglycerol/lipid kinase family protein n=1 Tax=Ideonella sp. BN130291 TaxID=3112940 RepID=UPI002E254E40|nr:diacylglycerol kinase family protein [Ideonella sp. BN130291]